MAKSFEVVFTSKAENDHRRMLSYLADNVSYQTSEGIDSDIIQSIRNLGKRPERNGLFKANVTFTIMAHKR